MELQKASVGAYLSSPSPIRHSSSRSLSQAISAVFRSAPIGRSASSSMPPPPRLPLDRSMPPPPLDRGLRDGSIGQKGTSRVWGSVSARNDQKLRVESLSYRRLPTSANLAPAVVALWRCGRRSHNAHTLSSSPTQKRRNAGTILGMTETISFPNTKKSSEKKHCRA